MSSFPRFLPRYLLTTAGEGAGDDEGRDAVARIRRWAMSSSMDSSTGNENSSRKEGWVAKFADGDGDRMDGGVELCDLE